jgi:hypothetical protein
MRENVHTIWNHLVSVSYLVQSSVLALCEGFQNICIKGSLLALELNNKPNTN